MTRPPTLSDELLSNDQLGALLDVAKGPLRWSGRGGWLLDEDREDGVPIASKTMYALQRRGLVELIDHDRRTGAPLIRAEQEWRITPDGMNYRDEVES